MLNPIAKLRMNTLFAKNLVALSLEEKDYVVKIADLDRFYVSAELLSQTSKLNGKKDRYWLNVVNYTPISSRAIMEHDTYIFLTEILVDGKPWNETRLFRDIVSGRTIYRSINDNGVWKKHVKIDNPRAFYSYYVNSLDLIRSIEQNGYIDVRHGDPYLLERFRSSQGGLASPVNLAIDHQGMLMHHTRGHHRIAIAKLLQISRLPVSVEFISGEYFHRFFRYSDLSTQDRFIDAVKRTVNHAVRPYLAP
jgi:hypothetical protein